MTYSIRLIRELVADNAARVAELGQWPAHVTTGSLVARVPESGSSASGFDAGVAVALGLIPADRGKLAAVLHAAYTPQAVAQVREEMGLASAGVRIDPDCESVWWLAACSVCVEEQVDEATMVGQCEAFTELALDPRARLAAAKDMLADMLDSFEVIDEVAHATRNGGMQGAYLAGYRIAVQYASAHDVFFVGTYEPAGLRLDGFGWREPGNPDALSRDGQMGRSGPVFGSRQFVKACDADELNAVLTTAISRMG